MKIALLGYGRMGHEIEAVALQRGHSIVLKITEENILSDNLELLKSCDVAIEFSTPQTVIDHITTCFKFKVPIVVGTTGWNKQEEEIKKLCIDSDCSLLYSSNFSIGVNLFFEINKRLAQLMNAQNQYNVSVTEIHHTQKLDAPSGTAISLANGILQNLTRKKEWTLNTAQNESDLRITAVREPNVPGTHSIIYESNEDIINITHEAKNRKGFAFGAVLAAEYICDKKGVFGMKDILNF